MISKAILSKAAKYRQAFQTAQPFKHVCIDDFFTAQTAEASLRDFPPFDREFAVNEYGEYGGADPEHAVAASELAGKASASVGQCHKVFGGRPPAERLLLLCSGALAVGAA